jgi:hypothetical protein
MNRTFNQLMLACLLILGACKKNEVEQKNLATLNVINGIIQRNVMLKTNGSINNSGANSSNSRQNRVSYGAGAFFYMEAKNTSIDFLDFIDSSSLFSKNLDLTEGKIYTVLLAGIAPNDEAVIIDDTNMPYVNLSTTPSEADSIYNIRFVNLAPDLTNIDVRIQGAATNEVSGLAYKAASVWKTYPAKIASGSSRRFEFVENGVLRGSANIPFSSVRFKNIALVLRGLKTPASGQPGLGVSIVAYFQ